MLPVRHVPTLHELIDEQSQARVAVRGVYFEPCGRALRGGFSEYVRELRRTMGQTS